MVDTVDTVDVVAFSTRPLGWVGQCSNPLPFWGNFPDIPFLYSSSSPSGTSEFRAGAKSYSDGLQVARAWSDHTSPQNVLNHSQPPQPAPKKNLLPFFVSSHLPSPLSLSHPPSLPTFLTPFPARTFPHGIDSPTFSRHTLYSFGLIHQTMAILGRKRLPWIFTSGTRSS